MGILSFLFGTTPKLDTTPAPRAPATQPAPLRRGPVQLVGTGDFDFEVVGESHYQRALEAICGGRDEDGAEFGCAALLVPEPANKYDRNAVAVQIGGRTVAYLARENAVEFHQAMRSLGLAGSSASCGALIVGGWDRNGDRGHFGVKLDLDWPPRPER